MPLFHLFAHVVHFLNTLMKCIKGGECNCFNCFAIYTEENEDAPG